VCAGCRKSFRPKRPLSRPVFTGDKSHDGSVTLDPATNPIAALHFRYRVIIHTGDAQSARIARMWDDFSKGVRIPQSRLT